MSDKKMPAFRLKYRDKDSKTTYDCGVVWPGRFDDSFDFQPQVGSDSSGKYPKMDTEEAIRLAKAKCGWLSFSRVRPSAGRPAHNLHRTESGGDGWDDPGVPF